MGRKRTDIGESGRNNKLHPGRVVQVEDAISKSLALNVIRNRFAAEWKMTPRQVDRYINVARQNLVDAEPFTRPQRIEAYRRTIQSFIDQCRADAEEAKAAEDHRAAAAATGNARGFVELLGKVDGVFEAIAVKVEGGVPVAPVGVEEQKARAMQLLADPEVQKQIAGK